MPQSLSRPHPPILIAGSGEKRTLPLVARYGDACNIRPSPEIPRQLDLLRRLCAEEGRDFDAIEKTAPFAFDVGEDGSKAGEVVERLRWLAGMGIETVFGWVVGVDKIRPIEIMGRDVIPESIFTRASRTIRSIGVRTRCRIDGSPLPPNRRSTRKYANSCPKSITPCCPPESATSKM